MSAPIALVRNMTLYVYLKVERFVACLPATFMTSRLALACVAKEIRRQIAMKLFDSMMLGPVGVSTSSLLPSSCHRMRAKMRP